MAMNMDETGGNHESPTSITSAHGPLTLGPGGSPLLNLDVGRPEVLIHPVNQLPRVVEAVRRTATGPHVMRCTWVDHHSYRDIARQRAENHSSDWPTGQRASSIPCRRSVGVRSMRTRRIGDWLSSCCWFPFVSGP